MTHSEAVAYYLSLNNERTVGDRSENPTLNKVNDVNYQLGRGNDLGIDVDLFIQGYDEYSTPTEIEPTLDVTEEVQTTELTETVETATTEVVEVTETEATTTEGERE